MAAPINVVCKLPNGIILDHAGKRVEIKGSRDSLLIGGFGVTQVDADLWTAWLAAHKDFPAVKSGLIFAQNNEANAKAEAREREGMETGLEGIDPQNPGKKAKISPEKIAAA